MKYLTPEIEALSKDYRLNKLYKKKIKELKKRDPFVYKK